MKCLDELVVLFIRKFGRSPGTVFVVDNLLERLVIMSEKTFVDHVRNEWDTSKTCSKCGDDTKSNRVERGLYVCESCGLVGNADCNGAENMRQQITSSPRGEDRSNGCVAQPSVHLFNESAGRMASQEHVV